MKTVHVRASREYDIHIGRGLVDRTGEFLRPMTQADRITVVTDDRVAGLYLERLEHALHRSGFRQVDVFVFPNGEGSKTLETAASVYDFLAEHHMTRSDMLIALGGGVVGDLTGFVASTFLRGIRFVQIPTTLLAQVDSSVGGKTAVDLSGGKNLVGTFWQPSLVLCDADLLDTLSEEIFADGAAEVIKYGAIRSRQVFDWISSPDYREHLEETIEQCICIKRDIVENDEFDTGERMLLNFGHTLAHSIENLSHYTISHGKAVAIGMAMITRASTRAGITGPGVTEEIEAACRRFGLKTETGFDRSQMVDVCLNDKKRSNNIIHAILVEEIGRSRVQNYSIQDFRTLICEGNP